jgi:DNA repair exonuclease SbcCD ATPase subunit
MGLFGWRKPKKEEEKTIKIAEIEDFLNEVLYKKSESINIDMHHAVKQIIELKKDALNALEQLETTELQNKNIPSRHIQIMEGNRKNYIEYTKNFLHSLNPTKKYTELEEFCQTFFESIDILNEKTQKNYFILKEFMAHEVNLVAEKLSQIEKIVTRISSNLQDLNLDKIDEIKGLLKKREDEISSRKEIEKEINEHKDEINKIKEKKEKTEKELNKLKKTTDFSSLGEFEKEKEKTDNELKEKNDQISKNFSKLKKALKKYNHAINDKLVNKYIENPGEALAEDKHLEIKKVLNDLKKQIDAGKISLKNKDREKTISAIGKTSELLKDLQKELNEIKNISEKISQKIKASSSFWKIRELDANLARINSEIKDKEKEINYAKDKHDSINPMLNIYKIKNILNELSEIKVNIKEE